MTSGFRARRPATQKPSMAWKSTGVRATGASRTLPRPRCASKTALVHRVASGSPRCRRGRRSWRSTPTTLDSIASWRLRVATTRHVPRSSRSPCCRADGPVFHQRLRERFVARHRADGRDNVAYGGSTDRAKTRALQGPQAAGSVNMTRARGDRFLPEPGMPWWLASRFNCVVARSTAARESV